MRSRIRMAGDDQVEDLRAPTRGAVSAVAAVSMVLVALLAYPGTPRGIAITHAASGPLAAAAKIAWPAFDGGGARNGANYAETVITPATVGGLGRLWQTTLPDVVDSAPVEQPNVVTPSGTRDLLFVTTSGGGLFAVDANSGAIVWESDHPAGSCVFDNTSQTCYTDSAPALDPSGAYVYTYGLDGFIHKHAVGDGTEITGGGWPEAVTLKPTVEKESSPLNIGNGYLYVSTASYSDLGDYQGHVVAINLATGAQTVFNTLCSNQPVHFVEQPGTPDCAGVTAGVWARGAMAIDPNTGNVFLATGNGPYDPASFDYGDSVIELAPDASTTGGAPADTYTPSNYADLQATDLDLGSSSPALLPQQPGSLTPYMAVQSGKDEVVRLLNRQNLSGQGGPNHTGGELQALALPQGGEVLTQPAVWTDPTGVTWVFIANGNGLSAFTLTTDSSGHSSLQVAYANGDSGSSPFVAGGVLYVQGYGVISALNPLTGTLLWSADSGGLHWQSPIVVNGHLYVTDNNRTITSYGPSAPPTTWYFAEGYTGGSFTTYLTLGNPGSATANVAVNYLLGNGTTLTRSYSVAPGSRTTVNVNGVIGSGTAGQAVSMVVQSDQPIVAERPMYFTYTRSDHAWTVPGGTDVVGANHLDTLYTFGYLDTSAQHDTYLSVLNPHSSAMTATVTYHSADGAQSYTTTRSIAATSRGTIYVNMDGSMPAGVYSASVRLSLSGLVERPLYFVDATSGVTGAADVMGQTFTWPRASFVEGYTGSGFTERYVLTNPGATPIHATVRLFDAAGTEHDSPTLTLAGYAQTSVDAVALLGPGVNNAAEVTADGGVLAERLMTFNYAGPLGPPPGPAHAAIPGATDVLGVPEPADTYAFAEGYTGGQFAEYLTVFNPDTSNAVSVTVTFLPQNAAPVTQTYTVAAGARFTLNTATVMGAQSFGMQVGASGPIVAERPMYFNYTAGGSNQTGGTCVTGYQS